jgi:hypothetical protein
MAETPGPLNSSQQPTSVLVGGVRNITPPAPTDEQTCALQVDASGNLKVAVGAIIGVTANVNVSEIGGVSESLANPLPVQLSDGSQALGDLANPVRVDPTGTTPQPVTAASLPLPANAAQETGGNLAAIKGDTDTLAGTVSAGKVQVAGTIAVTQSTSPWLDQINGVQAVVSAANSSTTPLAGNASFTGTSVDLTAAPGYTAVQVQVLASQNGTLKIQFSNDNSNWDHTVTGIVTANDSTSVSCGIHGRYMRVVYTNGATTQVGGYFRLQTLLVPTSVSAVVKDLDTPLDGDDNALVTHSVITGATTAGGGSFIDVKVNPSGTLATQDGMDATPGTTTAPSVIGIIGGKTNDGTPQYQPIPEGAGGRSVIVEGVIGGTAVPVSLASAPSTSVTQGTSPWAVSLAAETTKLIGEVKITDGTTVAAVISGTAALKTDMSSVAGSATATATTGVQLVGIEGRAGTSLETTAGVLDGNLKNIGNTAVVTAGVAGLLAVGGNVANAVAATANPVPVGGVFTTTPATLTTGQTATLQFTAAQNAKIDMSTVAGTATVTAASGVQKVGIVGDTGSTLDSTIGAATAPTNALATSAVFQSTIPVLTTGQAVAAQCDTTGSRYVNQEGRKATYSLAAGAITSLNAGLSYVFSVVAQKLYVSQKLP